MLIYYIVELAYQLHFYFAFCKWQPTCNALYTVKSFGFLNPGWYHLTITDQMISDRYICVDEVEVGVLYCHEGLEGGLSCGEELEGAFRCDGERWGKLCWEGQ